MSLFLINSGAGGSQGTTVTAANSGAASGNAFDVVGIGAGQTVIWDSSTPVYLPNPGDFMIQMTTAATVAINRVTWTLSLGTLTVGQTLSGRFYYVAPGTPSSLVQVMKIRNNATTLLTLRHNSTFGYIELRDSTGTAIGTPGSGALAANTLYRIEFVFTGLGTGSGTFTVNVYSGNTTTLVGSSYTSSAVNFGTLAPNGVDYGITSASASPSSTYYIGGLLLSDANALPGPELPPVTAIPVFLPRVLGPAAVGPIYFAVQPPTSIPAVPPQLPAPLQPTGPQYLPLRLGPRAVGPTYFAIQPPTSIPAIPPQLPAPLLPTGPKYLPNKLGPRVVGPTYFAVQPSYSVSAIPPQLPAPLQPTGPKYLPHKLGPRAVGPTYFARTPSSQIITDLTWIAVV